MIPLEHAIAFVRGEPTNDRWREAYEHPPEQPPLVDRIVTALRLQSGDKRAWLRGDSEAALVLRTALAAADVDVDDVADIAQRDFIAEAMAIMDAAKQGERANASDCDDDGTGC